MSVLKLDAAQLGDNADATKNFTLRTNNNGTLTLARGNVGATTQDLLTIGADGAVTLTQNARALQNMIASRAPTTPYVNNKPYDIELHIAMLSTVIASLVVTVAGQTVLGNTTPIGQYSTVHITVGPGETYSAVMDGGASSVVSWKERR